MAAEGFQGFLIVAPRNQHALDELEVAGAGGHLSLVIRRTLSADCRQTYRRRARTAGPSQRRTRNPFSSRSENRPRETNPRLECRNPKTNPNYRDLKPNPKHLIPIAQNQAAAFCLGFRVSNLFFGFRDFGFRISSLVWLAVNAPEDHASGGRLQDARHGDADLLADGAAALPPPRPWCRRRGSRRPGPT